ncbi:MAG: ArsR family transcriptional regulator [Candidatus Hydrogenedentota bacterium]|nr:MAG: ArsR family transcriptional regulator [Candidatus Hydrogenedentota bacterium]
MQMDKESLIATDKSQAGQLKLNRKKTIYPEDIHLFRTSVLRALSDETRQGIIVLLGQHKTLCVNDIAAYFNLARPTISHHLNVLKEAKIVEAKKQGKEMHYSLHVRFLKRSVKNLLKIVESIED